MMVDTCRYTFIHTHWMYKIKTEPNVDSELWVIMMCQCRFIKHTAPVGKLMVGGGSVGWLGFIGMPVLSTQFAVNPKLL